MDAAGIGRNIRAAREHRGLSVAELARRIGVDRSAAYNWERGTHPPTRHYGALKRELGVERFDLPAEQFDAENGISIEHLFITELPASGPEFDGKILELADSARRFVHYTRLCRTATRKRRYRPLELTSDEFVARLHRDEVAFQRVEIFFEEDAIQRAMSDALRFFGRNYYCNYFPTPMVSIPAINMRSYDNRHFVVGAFNDRAPGNAVEHVLLFDDKKPVALFLQQYWDVLWNRSKKFPPPDTWQDDDEIWRELGLTKSKWHRMVARANQEMRGSKEKR